MKETGNIFQHNNTIVGTIVSGFGMMGQRGGLALTRGHGSGFDNGSE